MSKSRHETPDAEAKKLWETPKVKRVGIVDTTKSSPFPTFPSRGEDLTYSTVS